MFLIKQEWLRVSVLATVATIPNSHNKLPTLLSVNTITCLSNRHPNPGAHPRTEVLP